MRVITQNCLKKIASILLISLLLFNWIGYRLLTQYLQADVSQKLEARLDQNDYNESELVEMRVALNLPYQNDQADFERVNGEVEIEGVHYSYVKRKIENGHLVLLCIPNQGKTKLENSSENYFKLVNDLQQNGDSKKSDKSSTTAIKGLFNEYRAEDNDWLISAPPVKSSVLTPGDTNLIPSALMLILAEPPEVC